MRASPADDLSVADLWTIYDAQATSHYLDEVARTLQAEGEGFYTIGSSGHESNAAIAHALRPDDPALLHYRSGGFYLARAAQVPGSTPIRDVLQGLMALADEPIAGGRHKVFGHPRLSIIPQTSTIASHLPRAVGLAIGLRRAYRLARRSIDHDQVRQIPWPEDAIVVCSFGDASANHSTATGAINTALSTAYRGLPVPVLFVCEDNGFGISVPTPSGWIEQAYGSRPGLDYLSCAGTDPVGVYRTTRAAADVVRNQRRPVFLHLHCVRFGGHAGSDAELSYRSRRAIDADHDRDPLRATARVLIDRGVTTQQIEERTAHLHEAVDHERDSLRGSHRLRSAAEVMAPLAPRHLERVAARAHQLGTAHSTDPAPLQTLAESINTALDAALSSDPQLIIFGEDVGAKGGVYGVTGGLARRHGVARVFDTVLDEQSILGLALGAALTGLLPIPEVQYLAYLHNAIDQLRGEAATGQFFSSGQFRNPMVLRLPGLSYQSGFGGHFHNDNAIASLRDIPGIVVGCPSRADDAAAMLRTMIAAGRVDGTVSVLLEPIALYHRRDLHSPGDRGWLAADDGADLPVGKARIRRTGKDLTMITFGNGVPMSLQVADRLAVDGIEAGVLDLRWLAPLPIDDIRSAAAQAGTVLVVDETRHSGGVGEGVITALVESGFSGSIARVASRDSFIPLGPAADHVLLGLDDVEQAARAMIDPVKTAPKESR